MRQNIKGQNVNASLQGVEGVVGKPYKAWINVGRVIGLKKMY